MNENNNLKLDTVKNNLQTGKAITYKELCKILDQPYLSGKQKQCQLKDFKRYFNFETSNIKLVITKIHYTVQPKEPKSNSLYVKYIECILLSMLAKAPENKIYITNNELYQQLGMANAMFVRCYNNYKTLVSDDITFLDIRDFYDRCNRNLASILNSSIKSLQNRKLIIASKEHIIGIMGENGIIDFYEAKDYELTEILRIERETMLKYGAEVEFQIYYNHKQKDYFKDLDDIYKKEYGWDKVYKTNKIIYCQETAINALSDDKIRFKKLLLNELIVNKFNKQSEASYQKLKDNQDMLDLFFDDLSFEDSSGNESEDLKKTTMNMINNDEASKYLKKQYYLTDTLIKLN